MPAGRPDGHRDRVGDGHKLTSALPGTSADVRLTGRTVPMNVRRTRGSVVEAGPGIAGQRGGAAGKRCRQLPGAGNVCEWGLRADRRRNFEHTSFGFLGYTFRARMDGSCALTM